VSDVLAMTAYGLDVATTAHGRGRASRGGAATAEAVGAVFAHHGMP
jgi:hypothetical protein